MDRLRWGVLSTADIARTKVIPGMRRARHVDLVAIASRDEATARRVAGYLGAVMGADAYDRYCAHLAAHHPDQQPPTEREFWREHMDWMERNPQGRCC